MLSGFADETTRKRKTNENTYALIRTLHCLSPVHAGKRHTYGVQYGKSLRLHIAGLHFAASHAET